VRGLQSVTWCAVYSTILHCRPLTVVPGSRYPYKPVIPLTVFVNPEVEVLNDTPMQVRQSLWPPSL
jgi:hypothetical protein